MALATGRGRFIYEAFSGDDLHQQKEAYAMFRQVLRPSLANYISEDYQRYGVSKGISDDWIDHLINDTLVFLWERIQGGRFRYEGKDEAEAERKFWGFVHKACFNLWRSEFRQLYPRNREGRLRHQPLNKELQASIGITTLEEELGLLQVSVYNECFERLENRFQLLLTMDPSMKERQVIEFLREHHPEINIPASGIRMWRSRCEKQLRECVETKLKLMRI